MNDPSYCWSDDEELFTGDFATREDAMEEAFADSECDTIWTGLAVPMTAEFVAACLADEALEGADCIVADNCGEAAEDWGLTVSKEAQQDLDTMLQETFVAWFKKHDLRIGCFGVDKIECHQRVEESEPEK